MNIQDILPHLISCCVGKMHESVLFNFQFSTLKVKGLFFARSKTITIGIKDKNVGWQIDIASGNLSTMIPNEAYRQISPVLKNEDGKFSNAPFFNKLKSALSEISLSNAQSATDEEIVSFIAACKTKDTKYDSEGEKPFFDHWRRVAPSSDSKKKIQRYFGIEVKEVCCNNKTTAVWSALPTKNSLLFLEPKDAIQNIKNA